MLKEHSIWVEKYRPDSLEGYLMESEDIKSKMDERRQEEIEDQLRLDRKLIRDEEDLKREEFERSIPVSLSPSALAQLKTLSDKVTQSDKTSSQSEEFLKEHLSKDDD